MTPERSMLYRSERLEFGHPADDETLRRWNDIIARYFFPFNVKALSYGGRARMDFGILRLAEIGISKIDMEGHFRATGWQSWDMIRQYNTRAFILWICERGGYELYQDGQSIIMNKERISLMRTDRPFRMAVVPDEEGRHLSYPIVISLSRMHQMCPRADELASRTYPATGASCQLAGHLLKGILESREEIAPNIAERFCGTALDVIASVLNSSLDYSITGANRDKLRDIMKIIDQHIVDHNLSPMKVAEKYQISTRYLHHLFRKRGISFMEYVHNKRLSIASTMLSAPEYSQSSVGEVSFMVGFNSQSHFGRLFLKKFGVSPSQFRHNYTRGRGGVANSP